MITPHSLPRNTDNQAGLDPIHSATTPTIQDLRDLHPTAQCFYRPLATASSRHSPQQQTRQPMAQSIHQRAPVKRTPVELHSLKFSSLKELNAWFVSRSSLPVTDRFLIPHEKLNTTRVRDTTSKTAMKVLVCHDFKGGYLENEDDSPVGYFPHETGAKYFLQFPSLVDAFVYFSHHRVTIPPVSWINMLHRHGIACLGTLIVEGRDNKDLDMLVERDARGKFVYVEQLVELAVRYGFEGWLLNIETTFTHPSLAGEIVLFTHALRSEMKLRVTGGQVVWYDAFLAQKNRVVYQNGVNELNYDHFDSSDYFFTNYWWDENKLKSNILNVGLQGSKQKLFVGIDVWGRGSKVGKGGFDTGLAMNFLRVYSANVALFAPGWTYENFQPHEFWEKDKKFWIGESSDAYPSGGVSTYIAHATAPVTVRADKSMTFYTNFSQGEGDVFKVMGKTVSNGHWVNGSLQMPTPTNLDKVNVTKSDAFNGGSSLRVSHKGPIAQPIPILKFEADLEFKDLNIAISFKQISDLVKDHYFQLEIDYYVERRFRSVTRVRDGSIKIPLHASHNWKYLETQVSLPELQAREHCVLEGVKMRWTNTNEALLNQDGESSWIMVNNETDPNAIHELLLGDLMIECGGVQRAQKVTSVKLSPLQDRQVFVQWVDSDEVLMWLFYENAKFLRPLTTPCFISYRGDKVRVDCVTRSGKLIVGDDIFL